MIGTHDSYSYLPAENHLLNLCPRLWRTQDMPLYKQYAEGIRFFDIRLRFDSDRILWQTCHGWARFGIWYTTLEQICREMDTFVAGANWAYDTPKWKDFATEKPRHGQRMLAFLKGGMLMPCYYRDDDSQDAILHIGNREVNFGPVEIVLWLPLPNNLNLTQEGAK